MAAETKKSEEKDVKEKESGGSLLENIRGYFSDVRTELNKVSWPDREDVVRLTRIVLAVIISASVVLGTLSVVLAYFMNDTHFDTVLQNIGLNRTPIFVVLFAIILGVTWWMFRQDDKKSY
jgi:preprotein translocase SecE subunit